MADLGKAYVQIVPSAEGIANKIRSAIMPGVNFAGESAGTSLGSKIASMALKAISVVGIGKAITSSIKEGAGLEQSIGGIETLFKDSASKIRTYASEAYKTSGISANKYMEQVTSFSASLIKSLGGDTSKAAEISNMSMVDMSDNANKMGTNMEDIQNAYQGFAKQNYAMLDNLKLGYGGTKSEMERLLADAQELTGVKYDINNLSDVYEAIHAIQTNLGITGTTAKEASETVSGSFNAMKAAAADLLGNLALGEAIGPSTQHLIDTTKTFLVSNLIPMVITVLSSIPPMIGEAFNSLAPDFINYGKQIMDSLGIGLSDTSPIFTVFESLKTNLDPVINSIVSAFNQLPILFQSIAEGILPIIESIASGLSRLDFSGISALIDTLIPAIKSGFETMMSIVAPAIDMVVNSFVNLWNAAQPLVTTLSQALKPAFDVLGAFLGGVFKGILIGIASTFDMVKLAIDFLKPVVDLLVQAFIALSPVFSKIAEWVGVIIGLFGNFSTAGTSLKDIMKSVWENIKGAVKSAHSVITGAIDGIKSLFSTLSTAGSSLKNSLSNSWSLITGSISNAKATISRLIDGIKSFFSSMTDSGNSLKSAMSSVWDGIKNVISAGKNAISGFIDSIVGFFKSLSSAGESLSNAIEGAWSAMTSAVSSAVNSIGGFISDIFNSFNSLHEIDISGAGRAIMNGFLDGLQAAWGAVTDFIGGIGSWIAEHKGPISYDKKLLIPAGNAIMNGLNKGLVDNFNDVKDTVRSMAPELENCFGTADLRAGMDIDHDINNANNSLRYKVDSLDVADRNINEGNPKPVELILNFGDRILEGFVEDITRIQDKNIALKERF